MPKPRAERDLKKVTLNLFDGDFEKLQSWYPRSGAGAIVRKLVHQHVTSIEAQSGTHEFEREEAPLVVGVTEI